MAIIYRLNLKSMTPGERGIPKKSIDEVQVTREGIAGDFNRYREEKLDGELDSAVLLLAQERLEELASEGWPVGSGDLGENITTRDLDFRNLGSGSRLKCGDEAILELSRRCDPCTQLRVLPYVGREKISQFIKTLTGNRGWYARVEKAGTLKKGDPISLV